MKRVFVACWMLVLTATAWAKVAAPSPLPIRLNDANAVFVGRVIGFEDQEISVEPYPNAKQAIPYRIATVAVVESMKGPKADSTVRIGVPASVAAAADALRDRRPSYVKPGQDGIFLLHMHPSGKFYQPPSYGNFISRVDEDFNQQLAELKSASKTVNQPREALNSKDASERLIGAYLLLRKYNTPVGTNQKREAIDAQESKLIVEAILHGIDNRRGGIDGMSLFYSLRLTPQDGFNPPADLKAPAAFQAFAKDWLEKNKDTYRIKKFVAEQ